LVPGQGRHRAPGREPLGPGLYQPRKAYSAKLTLNVVSGVNLRLVEALLGYSTKLTISNVTDDTMRLAEAQ
jgi:hypothetical protein